MIKIHPNCSKYPCDKITNRNNPNYIKYRILGSISCRDYVENSN